MIYGAGLSYTYKTPADRYLSVVSSNATYSTKEMLNLNVKTNLFAASGRWLINTDWRLQDNTETTFGLGTGNPAAFGLHWDGLPTSRNAQGQALHYQQIRFHQIVSRRLAPNFFAGLGFRYDHYQHISDDKTKTGDSLASYQVRYSESHGFNPVHYTVSGVCANLLYDGRDNEVDAYTGNYINLSYQFNNTSQTLLLDFRSYHPPRQQKGEHPRFLGLWSIPDQRQPPLSGPARHRLRPTPTLRTGICLWPLPRRRPAVPGNGISLPCRRPVGRRPLLNLTSTTDKTNHLSLGQSIQAGYGGGLRFMLDRAMRSRLQLDIGAGKKSLGFYFGIQETF